MRLLKLLGCLFLALVGLSMLFGMSTAQPVSATTGPSDVPAHYTVPLAVARAYPGQYVLQATGGGARITRAQMIINFNSLDYLTGVGQFTGYDAQGHLTVWVADMYNFRLTRAGMEMPLLLANTNQLGTMYLHVTKAGDLEGQLVLFGKSYPIIWHKNLSIPSDQPLRCIVTRC
jgi:hypothetical protein